MKYDGIRDRHLNVFVQYDGKEHLENNITKAFINTLDALDDEDFIKVLNKLFEVNIPKGEITREFYLQKKPSDEKVKKFDINDRKIFAFSPTGKSWGIEGIDSNDKNKIKAELKKLASDENSGFTKDDIEPALKEILKSNSDRGSIPDAWLFIYVNKKPFMLFAMENKLYNLNPYQIRNHTQKSLHIATNLPAPTYKKYDDIVCCFKDVKNYMTNQFNEYMIILGYAKIDDFEIACRADSEDGGYFRQRLIRNGNFGIELLNKCKFGTELDYRDKNVARCKVNYEYLSEINLKFADNDFELWLSFGPKQESSKKMLQRINSISIDDKRLKLICSGFHAMYKRGRIIKKSYISCIGDVNEYISFWKKNINLIKTCTPNDAIELFKYMINQKVAKKNETEDLIKHLANKKNEILIIPEISLVFHWDYDDAATLGIDGMAKQLKEVFDKAKEAMKLT